ncbi:MAG: cobalamin-binding protein [Ignavibacteriales bacterium]|nr:cobalamin-binding protein [Ignavibacteriales bacterium]
MFALGLDSSVVGVTDFCDEPPQVRGRARVGGMISPSFETIVSLKPDLILMTIAGNSRADHDRLVSLGFQVVVTNPSSLEGIYESIALIGSLTGSRTRADSLISQLRSKQRELVSRARMRPARSVLLLVSLRPIIAAGSGTFLHELIGLANGRNVAAHAPSAYPMLGREYILERDPDVIVVMNDVASSPRDVVEAYPEWKNLSAVHRNSVHILDASVVSRPGPRIMNGLELLVSSLN